jgi:hypothetical protein
MFLSCLRQPKQRRSYAAVSRRIRLELESLEERVVLSGGDPVSLSPQALPPATVGTYYNQLITVTGGTYNSNNSYYTWDANPSSADGLGVEGVNLNGVAPVLSSQALAIEGMPTSSGTITFTVTANGYPGDPDDGESVTQTYILTVNPASQPPAPGGGGNGAPLPQGGSDNGPPSLQGSVSWFQNTLQQFIQGLGNALRQIVDTMAQLEQQLGSTRAQALSSLTANLGPTLEQVIWNGLKETLRGKILENSNLWLSNGNNLGEFFEGADRLEAQILVQIKSTTATNLYKAGQDGIMALLKAASQSPTKKGLQYVASVAVNAVRDAGTAINRIENFKDLTPVARILTPSWESQPAIDALKNAINNPLLRKPIPTGAQVEVLKGLPGLLGRALNVLNVLGGITAANNLGENFKNGDVVAGVGNGATVLGAELTLLGIGLSLPVLSTAGSVIGAGATIYTLTLEVENAWNRILQNVATFEKTGGFGTLIQTLEGGLQH